MPDPHTAKAPSVADLAHKVRSKNAGPFWVTIDVFCSDGVAYERLKTALTVEQLSTLYQQPADVIKRYELADLKVLKFSFPRPVVQGSRFDRDMHGAQYGVLLEEFEICEHKQ